MAVIAPVRDGVSIGGTSAKRPRNAPHGHIYYDETLRKPLVWNANWKIWTGADYYDGDAGEKVLFTDFQNGLPSFLTVTQGSDDLTAEAHINSAIGEYSMTSGNADGAVTVDGVVMDAALAWEGEEGGGIEARCGLKIDSIANAAFYFGFHDRLASSAIESPFALGGSNAITSTATDGCGFLFDTGADTDEIWCLGVSNDTDSVDSATSGIAPVAGTYLDLMVRLIGTTAKYYINDALVKTLTGASRATIDLTPCILVDGRTTASKVLTIDYLLVKPVNYPVI
jgi:hypothetical protein